MELGQYGISRNPNLTLEWLEKYPDKDWCWGYGISSNKLTAQKKLLIEKQEKAAFIIQKQWDICRYNPEYQICKNIVTKEYEMLMLGI